MNARDIVSLLGIAFLLAVAAYCTFFCIPVITARWMRDAFAATHQRRPKVIGKAVAIALLALATMTMGGFFIAAVANTMVSHYIP